jgi:hypothetical protein
MDGVVALLAQSGQVNYLSGRGGGAALYIMAYNLRVDVSC